jgi:EF hand
MGIKQLILILGAALCVGWIPVGMAETTENRGPDLWLLAKYDSNGDQVISLDEISVKREKLFGYMDSNQDREVSFDEYQGLDIQKRKLLLKARFDKLDADRDGKLSDEEYRSYFGSFARFDQNEDGSISSEEIASGSPAKVEAAAKEKDDGQHCLLWVCVRDSIH